MNSEPPSVKVTSSIMYGLPIWYLVEHYQTGVGREEFAEMATNGWFEFWPTPEIAAWVTMIVVVAMLWETAAEFQP